MSDQADLPSAPYPGLRPFLDHEDMLMNGRQAQVEDLVQRLGRPRSAGADAGDNDGAAPPFNRFVAVIGGSGSGKSSLIRAGVVPYLRQFGIPEAGDLWEAVVVTPGTNFLVAKAGEVAESPITRLAQRFERVLRDSPQPERLAAIAQTLRRPGGLGLVVDLYGPELALPDGVRPEDACVLVVIDQFEELFHKTNLGSSDARHLVERVIDHYHQAKQGRGSTKCFLAITMRSEHLNDCAGYLGLPEAINAGSYLVSRLDDTQVREVIEKPAQRYLRLRQRERQSLARHSTDNEDAANAAAAPLPDLPRAVAFEPGLVERLVDDTRRIAADPDHLPLLQHCLARLWGVALKRCQLPADGVPDLITLDDLWLAAQATVNTPPAADANVLQLSLNAWAEAAYLSHPEPERAEVLALMRRLAYKDSRTGTYNQQRLYVATHGPGAERLHTLVRGRWIDTVDYLHWDKDDPARVTLKVSHESFIRGWLRLRQLADHEAWRLEQHMVVLAATQRWVDRGCRAEDLLDARDLALAQDARLTDALGPNGSEHDADAETATWLDWQGWLQQLPQGQALQAVSRGDARRFVRQSHQALALAERRGKRTTRTIGALVSVIGVTVLLTAFSVLVQQPVSTRSLLFIKAANLANQVSLRNAYPEIGGSAGELETLLEAAALLQRARTPQGAHFGGFSDAVLQSDYSPFKGLSVARVLPESARMVEPPVNGKLRALLTRSVWRTPLLAADGQAEAIGGEGEAPLFNVACDKLTGTLKPVEGSRRNDPVRRGVFVSNGELVAGRDATDTRNNLMYTATVLADGTCTLGRQLMALPRDRDPAVMFDATLSNLMLAVDGDGAGAPSTVSFQRVRWDDPETGGSAEIHQPLAVVFNNQTAEALRSQVPQAVGMAAATWRLTGGRAVQVEREAWRVVADTAQRLVPQPRADDLRPLQDDPQEQNCQRLRTHLEAELRQGGSGSPEATTRLSLLHDGEHCLAVLRMPQPNPTGAGGAVNPATARDLVHLRAYARPQPEDLDDQGRLRLPPVAMASFEYGRVRSGEGRWFTGRPGTAWAGWLVMQRPGNQNNPARYTGMPWSTQALLDLGAQVLKYHQAVDLGAGRPVRPSAAGSPPRPASAGSGG